MATASLAAEVSYRNDVHPLIKARCSDCHGDESPALADFLQDQQRYKKEMQGPRLGSYGELIQVVGWPETGALMRRLDDGTLSANKRPGNMYMHLGDTDAERAANLTILKVWVGDGAWNPNLLEKTGDVPAGARDLMDKLKLKY